MSKVSDFYAKVIADETLKSQIASILAGVSIENAEDEQLEKIGEVAKGLGFDISVEEAKEYFHMNDEELSDEALGAVAGGSVHHSCKGKQFSADIGGGEIPSYHIGITESQCRASGSYTG